MMKYEIEVNQTDIQSGEPSQCTKCPIAIAISRSTGLPQNNIHVLNEVVQITKGKGYINVPLPEIAIRFIETYDKLANLPMESWNLILDGVEGFSFDLWFDMPTNEDNGMNNDDYELDSEEILICKQ